MEEHFRQKPETSGTALKIAEVLGLEPQKAVTIYRGSGARFTMPSYWQDYQMPARAAVDARPQAGFVRQAQAAAATA